MNGIASCHTRQPGLEKSNMHLGVDFAYSHAPRTHTARFKLESRSAIISVGGIVVQIILLR